MSSPADASARPYVSVVIPAFNEARRIGPTLLAIGAYLDRAPYSHEIVIIDDGSRDRTRETALAARPAARVLANEANRGKGYTVRRGVREARGEIIVFSDADLSTPIEELDRFIPLMESGADVVMGSRALRESRIEKRQNILREMAGRCFNLLLRLLTGLPFHDTQCGFKAFRRRAADEIFSRQRIEGWGFDAELITIALRRGFRVVETPVRWINSPDSRLQIWRDAPRMLADLIRIRLNDLRGLYK